MQHLREKEKKMPRQIIMRQAACKMPLSSFVLAIYCWAWGVSLTVVVIPSDTLQKKLIFTL